MFWRKKKAEIEIKEANTLGQLFTQAIILTDKYVETLLGQKYITRSNKEMIDRWTFFMVVASVSTALFRLDDPYFNYNYTAVKAKLEDWDSKGEAAAEDFIQFVSNSINGSSIDNIHEIVGLWLYYNIKGSTELIEGETKPYLAAGNVIIDAYFDWFANSD